MSIVNEALKKINLNRAEKRPVIEQPKPSMQNNESTPQINITNVTHSKTPYIIIASVGFVAIVITLFIFVFFINNNQSASPKLASKSQAPSISSSAMDISLVSSDVPPQKESGTLGKIFSTLKNRSQFQLSGIVYSDADPSAIINDVIVKEGDEIAGAKVESIQETIVKLSYKGEELSLAVE